MSPVNYATAQLIRLLPRADISRAFGRLADYEWPEALGRAVVSVYSRAYDVRFDECVERDGFRSFDDFFTRQLKEGARPIAAAVRVLTSPADGRLESMSDIDETASFLVKGRPYRVSELVGGEAEARRYEGGRGCVVYLSPRDYHRVHAPCAGRIGRICSMPGDFYPVNNLGLEYVPNLFARNRRVAVGIDTPEELGLGRVTLVFVAAMIVGRITLTGIEARDVPLGAPSPDSPWTVARGEEVGAFHLGSTVVVLVEKRAAGRWLSDGGPIRFGAPLIGPPDGSPAIDFDRPAGKNGVGA